MSTLIRQSQLFDAHLVAVPVIECGEPMVSLPDLLVQYPDAIIQYSSSVQPYFRVSVARALCMAAQQLYTQGYTLLLFDGYRSIATQKMKFFQRVDELQQKYPKMNKQMLYDRANIFIAGIPILAAHTSGAAVDVGLADVHGNKLDMGTTYRTGSYKSKTAYRGISKSAQRHRMLLCDAMEKAGYINYPFEWWHYSLGDVCAAYCSHALNAIYGPVEYDEKKRTTTYEPQSLWHDYFI
jgi:D-alanyl-D-alanine dipeptidase